VKHLRDVAAGDDDLGEFDVVVRDEHHPAYERIFIELMRSDRKLKASREGSK